MQPNIPLRVRQHHTDLEIEINQSRGRPTSRSLLKLPVSGLYLKLLVRGSTFLLAPSGTTGPIAGKPREKVELLSLSFLPLFSCPPSSSSYCIVWSKVKFGEYFLATCQYPIGSLDYPYHLRFLSNHVLPHVSYGSHLGTYLTYSALDTWHTVNHSSLAKCLVLPSVP